VRVAGDAVDVFDRGSRTLIEHDADKPRETTTSWRWGWRGHATLADDTVCLDLASADGWHCATTDEHGDRACSPPPDRLALACRDGDVAVRLKEGEKATERTRAWRCEGAYMTPPSDEPVPMVAVPPASTPLPWVLGHERAIVTHVIGELPSETFYAPPWN
jgi:hypothetical protein